MRNPVMMEPSSGFLQAVLKPRTVVWKVQVNLLRKFCQCHQIVHLDVSASFEQHYWPVVPRRKFVVRCIQALVEVEDAQAEGELRRAGRLLGHEVVKGNDAMGEVRIRYSVDTALVCEPWLCLHVHIGLEKSYVAVCQRRSGHTQAYSKVVSVPPSFPRKRESRRSGGVWRLCYPAPPPLDSRLRGNDGGTA